MKPWSRGRRTGWRGFTLIELLTVIAIIAILAGLLFPVMATVRENNRKTACVSNMHQIAQAMKMYKDDWRVYPDALYGVSYAVGGVPQPFGLRLANGYVKDPAVFTCPNHPQALKGLDAGKAPTNPAMLIGPVNKMTGAPHQDRGGRPIGFSRSDSYDWQVRPNTAGAVSNLANTEVHYTREWTPGPRGIGDNPRQLVYKEPPDNTVVTWCMYHSNLSATGAPAKGTVAPVAFLSGRVQMHPAENLISWPPAAGPRPWEIMPKP